MIKVEKTNSYTIAIIKELELWGEHPTANVKWWLISVGFQVFMPKDKAFLTDGVFTAFFGANTDALF